MEQLRNIAEKRTKGKWLYTYSSIQKIALIPREIRADKDISDEIKIEDAEFISLSSITYDALLDIAEAAKYATNTIKPVGFLGETDLRNALKKLEEL